MNGAQLTLEILNRHQVESVFGYPGGAIMPIYDALYDSEIKHYLCRHEQGAAFAALGYAKASGKVGVCFATSGPGVTNLITGLADANADSVPVVAITGQVATTLMGTDAFQEIDVLGLSLAVTKHAFQVTEISELEATLEQAFTLARSGRPGAVIVDIPKDVQLAQVTRQPQLIQSEKINRANDEEIEAAKALMRNAEKPILYVGGGVAIAKAVDEVRAMASETGAPSVCTLKGLGSIAPNDPHFLGMIGMHGSKSANLAVQACDLLIVIGARFDDRVTGKLSEFAPHAKVIHLDIDPAEVNKLRQANVSLVGDFKYTLPALSIPLNIKNWREICAQMARDYAPKYRHGNESYDSDIRCNKPGFENANRDNASCDNASRGNASCDNAKRNETTSIHAPSLLKRLSQIMPPRTTVTTDVGQHQMWVAQHMQFERPEKLITSGALGSMGFGIPAAIGAQIANQDDGVLAISGDGSFMMNLQELATIKRFSLPLKILLIDNTKLGMVRQWQSLFFDKRFSETDLSDNPDFASLANAFSIPAQTISRHVEIESALARMFSVTGPYLLHVKIDQDQNVWPLVPPNTANQAMMEG